MAHSIIDVIKYEGDNSTFVWKHPCEDFNTKTQLIVHEGQEALVLVDGKTSEPKGPGRYTLDTKNFPIIRGLVNLVTGGENPFHCEVYYVNKTVQMGMKWGTDSKVRYIDPNSGIQIELGACGEMKLTVADSPILLTKLVGTMKGIAWGDSVGFTKSLQNSFRPLISTIVKSNLISSIKEKGVNILEVDEHLEKLSSDLKTKINIGFTEYGLSVPQFYVTTVVLPEEDPNFKRLRELTTIALQTRVIEEEAAMATAKAQADAQVAAAQRAAEMERQKMQTEVAKQAAERKVIAADAEIHAKRAEGLADAEIMRAKGYTERDVLNAEVQKVYAEGLGKFASNMGNSGSGSGYSGGSCNRDVSSGGVTGIANDMCSMMAGMKMAEKMIGHMDRAFAGMDSAPKVESESVKKEEKRVCTACGSEIPYGAKFCLNCGTKIAPAMPEEMMICPGCGSFVLKGRFCQECGYKFITACPGCGAELPAGAKFCLECGAKLG